MYLRVLICIFMLMIDFTNFIKLKTIWVSKKNMSYSLEQRYEHVDDVTLSFKKKDDVTL
jgi:hypothetical protein